MRSIFRLIESDEVRKVYIFTEIDERPLRSKKKSFTFV